MTKRELQEDRICRHQRNKYNNIRIKNWRYQNRASTNIETSRNYYIWEMKIEHRNPKANRDSDNDFQKLREEL